MATGDDGGHQRSQLTKHLLRSALGDRKAGLPTALVVGQVRQGDSQKSSLATIAAAELRWWCC